MQRRGCSASSPSRTLAPGVPSGGTPPPRGVCIRSEDEETEAWTDCRVAVPPTAASRHTIAPQSSGSHSAVASVGDSFGKTLRARSVNPRSETTSSSSAGQSDRLVLDTASTV